MSLFQSREWWSTRNGVGDEFDTGCLCVGNADNEASGKAKILVGSFAGMLRIYFPQQKEFKIEDLLMEQQLPYPILHLELGRFVANRNDLAIAVLHPRHLVIYTLESVGREHAQDSANYFQLQCHLNHAFGDHFTAYTMIKGRFGNSLGRDHLCVESMDGRLQVFEQDHFAFAQQLHTCLVPGPLCYISQTDSILTGTSDMWVEGYKYQVLATTSSAACLNPNENPNSNEDGPAVASAKSASSLTKKKTLVTDWRTNIGESILAIRVGRVTRGLAPSQLDIVVLGENSIYYLKSNGEMRLQKRLGYNPSTLVLYRRPDAGGDECHNIIIGTHTKQWMIYKDNELIWSTCTPSIPIQLDVAQFGSTPGMIVSLDEKGLLNVNYLGTDPPSSIVGASDVMKELNYEEIDEEHRQLLLRIRESQSSEPKSEPRDRVLLRVQVPEMLDSGSTDDDHHHHHRSSFGQEEENQNPSNLQLTIRVFVTYTGKDVVSNLTLSIQTPVGIHSSQSSFALSSLHGNTSTPFILPITLYPGTTLTPASLESTVSISYTLPTGQPRTTVHSFALPLVMACRIIPPIKSSAFKFTLETNQEVLPPLNEIFQDLERAQDAHTSSTISSPTSANVMSFQYYNGKDVTILVSKNAGRYRIQSDYLESLWLVSNELVLRLTEHFETTQRLTIGFSYQEPLPLADFFSAIDHHFEVRQEKDKILSQINDRAHQFRVIQKRLLVRYKDRNPAPLNQLDTLLHETYEQLITLAERLEMTNTQLALASNRLSCSTYLVQILMKLRFELDRENFDILCAHLSGECPTSAEQGWEERTDAAMTHLLRTSLAKTSRNAKNTNHVSMATELLMATETKKLKKHITIVCDRLAKGARLVDDPDRET